MEYCRCGSLESYLVSGNAFSEDELREIASCCLIGLHYLHCCNVIHRVMNLSYCYRLGHQTGESASFRKGTG